MRGEECDTRGRAVGVCRVLGRVDDATFPQLLVKLLELDPDRRITPLEMLLHPFLAPSFPFAAALGDYLQATTTPSIASSRAHAHATPAINFPTPQSVLRRTTPPKNNSIELAAADRDDQPPKRPRSSF